ncbi:MAG: metalloregulator ArsR/SmtB family transcription factor [Thermoplasmatales archaeon]|nr:metalloregulator ArsR/SmtB family transcription factor [Thermoplasmatales archaeon]MCW6170032.1 metalloregulator ArsR/SmtB family transcription factor [Thermoplasmatales archaeon]
MERRSTRNNIARALSNPERTAIIEVLASGTRNVGSIVKSTGIPQPKVSAHLSELRSVGLVAPHRSGREIKYTLIPEPLESYSMWLDDLAGSRFINSIRDSKKRTPAKDGDFSKARTCYDHLAGKLGVELLHSLIEKSWIAVDDAKKPTYKLTDIGTVGLQHLGVNIRFYEIGKRMFAYGCRDVSEQEYHLGGFLGAVILKDMIKKNIVSAKPQTRTLKVNGSIAGWFSGTQ